MSTTADVADEQGLAEALADLRSDDTEVNLVVLGHVNGNPNLVDVVHVGTSLSEVADVLDPKQTMYVVVRLTSTFDMSTTVKFVYAHWVGNKVPYATRGKCGVVHESVRSRLGAFHLELETDSVEDLTQEAIMQKLEENSGTKSKVLESTEGRQERGFTSSQILSNKTSSTGHKSMSSTKVNAVSKEGAPVQFAPEVPDAVADVRDDGTATNWMLAGYERGDPKQQIVVLGSGTGGLEELKAGFDNSLAMYALLRVTDVVDDITTVKFVYILWMGDKVKPMSRAKVSTHKGAVEEMFKPAHVTIFASDLSDLKGVMDKVTSASGTKVHVRSS
ncbi:uncharacterized protein LOC106150598 [Lingula anatina]|uniref:Coactosin-like protein n=1 Tax=Lingula anatina TaxID=7574 RepID=A0A1S3H1C9_LINAN|nr:uncharacterized protein LOC106150598 [Lingula anatina]XP_013378949.1 uncharacterized protein LOC106150598 [Lingula anatina]|eukprot:XP_013378948.1 uncharacterized protein LOC106150598 [Lingula anatina]